MGIVRTPLRRRPGSWRAIRQDPLRVLWSQVVRARDRWTCRKCGARKKLGARIEAAHVLGAGAYPQLKYVVENGIALCSKEHRWSHDHPEQFTEWVKREIGIDRYTRLLVLAKTMRRPSKTEVRISLREQLKTIEEDTP